MSRALLILSCSATKRFGDEFVSAYDQYDGPAFRVLRASGYPHASEGPSCRLMILSAEHGLISGWHDLEPYDRRMDEARARELAALDPEQLYDEIFQPVRGHRDPRDDFDHFPADEVFVFGGALYRSVIQAWVAVGVFAKCPRGVTYTSGGIGEQLGQLKRWLVQRTPQAVGRVSA